MNTRDSVIKIMKEVIPTKDLVDVTDIIESGYIDSMELMVLISQLCEDFNIEISFDDITAENFNSVDAITAMVERLK